MSTSCSINPIYSTFSWKGKQNSEEGNTNTNWLFYEIFCIEHMYWIIITIYSADCQQLKQTADKAVGLTAACNDFISTCTTWRGGIWHVTIWTWAERWRPRVAWRRGRQKARIDWFWCRGIELIVGAKYLAYLDWTKRSKVSGRPRAGGTFRSSTAALRASLWIFNNICNM